MSKRNQINVHGRIDELVLDAKSVVRSYAKHLGGVAPNEVNIFVTTNDHFLTYKVVGIDEKGVTVVYEKEGMPMAYGFHEWSGLMPYTIFTVVKMLYLSDVIKVTGR